MPHAESTTFSTSINSRKSSFKQEDSDSSDNNKIIFTHVHSKQSPNIGMSQTECHRQYPLN